ncbi:MAG: F0F1 ATP synthase subunit gamma [Nitrospira sp.]|nr:F0F1 ATP synthase subunit gamma [Nitrospira sp.]MCP9462771.1 F0F1 ATP synthase subunit gamma [Nitrospira sp.]MCP9475989.1 F0F1 ATP synthase subunit gamma [Nitrospira sp.]
MSKRHELSGRIQALSDIKGILNAMKNLALMEVHKLSRFLSAQQRVVGGIEEAAADFFRFHPALLPSMEGAFPAFLLIGSERGFCGDFNESLLAEFDRCRAKEMTEGDPLPLIVTVGHKLAMKIGSLKPAVALAGPSVTEEVPSVLVQVVEALHELQRRRPAGTRLDLVVLSHGNDDGNANNGRAVIVRRPFREFGRPRTVDTHPPLLTMLPIEVATKLLDHYLFAVLHEMFYTSLMAENRRRFQHMDQALQRLEKETGELTRKYFVLRQEEITQEIAVIMLSAEIVGENGAGPAQAGAGA